MSVFDGCTQISVVSRLSGSGCEIVVESGSLGGSGAGAAFAFVTVIVLGLTAYFAWRSAEAAGRSAEAAHDTLANQRRLETMKLISETEMSEAFALRAECFSRYRKSDGLLDLIHPRTEQQHLDRRLVLEFLNHYELISLSIQSGLLDEDVYRSWMQGAFTRDWNDGAAAFVDAERSKSDQPPKEKTETVLLPPPVSRPVHRSTRLDEPPVRYEETVQQTEPDAEEVPQVYNERIYAAYEAMVMRWDENAVRIGPAKADGVPASED